MSDSEKEVKLSVYVSEDVRARFKATCAIQKVSMNHVVNQLLEDWLVENDAMKKHLSASSDGTKGTGDNKGRKEVKNSK